jgi:Uma2 family endonuclease
MQLLVQHGVREYWLVDPEAITIEVFQLAGNRFTPASAAGPSDIVRSPLLPHLTIAPRELVPFE